MADISKPDEPANKVKDPVPVHGTSDKPNGEQASRVGTDMGTPDGPEEKRRATETEEKRRQWWKPTREWAAITISIAALCVSFGSCYNSNRSANIAESVFRITQSNERPWVSVEVRLSRPVLVFSKEGDLGLTIDVDVRDVGRAVALDIISWAELVFLDPDGRDIAAQERQIERCGDDRYPPPPSEYVPGMVLFPGAETRQLSVDVGQWAKDIAPEVARALPANKGKVGFVIVGCISYRAAFEEVFFRRHQTRFLYHLVQWGDDEKFTSFIKPRGNPKNVALGRMRHGNTAD